MLQADEPFPDENLLPPEDDSDEVNSRIGSDIEDGEGEASAPAGSEGDDGEDLMDNVSGYVSAVHQLQSTKGNLMHMQRAYLGRLSRLDSPEARHGSWGGWGRLE